jgi:Tfp pilus assembly protein PilN
MMHINLLPPELLERRLAEKRLRWVVVAAFVVAALLAVAWFAGYTQLQSKRSELADIKQQTAATQAQADQLAIFEERAVALEERRAIVELALGDRRNWAKLYDELSLVLPSDVWVQSLTTDEVAGLTVLGYGIDVPTDYPDTGHKSIAKVLLRLADLEQLHDVWLTNSVKQLYEEQPAIQYTITAGVHAPETEGETP